MAEEEKELPSVRKREVELGKGIVLLPPERLEVRAKEEKPQEVRPKPEVIIKTAPAQNLIAVIAIFLALVSAILASFSLYTVYKMKSELRAIATDLRNFQDSNIIIYTEFSNVTHSVQASLPLKEVITPFTLPIIPQELSGKGAINVVLPGMNIPVSIPWEGNITVTGNVRFDTTQLAEDRKMSLSYELPGRGYLTVTIKGKDLWTTQLENITQRIEAMSQ